MKKLCELLLSGMLSLVALGAFGQKQNSSIQMLSDYSSDNPDLRDLLFFEGIDYYKIKFVGAALAGKDYVLVAKEIWNGEIKKIDTLVNTAKNSRMEKLSTDTLNLKVIAKKKDEHTLKVSFRFPEFLTERTFEATPSDDYSLRDVGKQLAIEPGRKFYALAYILPYEKDGWKLWCAVDSSGKDIESWGKAFGIVHYLVFEMKFE